MNPTISLIISGLIFILIIRGQFRGMNKPLGKSGITLLLPILYISTSLTQLLDPRLAITGSQVVIAVLIGVAVSIPLIFTTSFEARGDGKVYIKRNNAVFVILVIVFGLRFLLLETIHSIDPGTLGFVFNLVTLSYIAIWRSVSFVKFRSVGKSKMKRYQQI
ncbi:CcdC protein domain-containing protein [Paenibacillus pinihumi]|uniref:CcdC protein domain-containing protein n=1 Tax=Paenibacillus pinihumi TaxID=669462 RepID=UPI00040DA88D|nr:CcdC protein domain-containing protein [Paenibacillus pinihumi]